MTPQYPYTVPARLVLAALLVVALVAGTATNAEEPAPAATFPLAGWEAARAPRDLATPEERFPFALSGRADALATGAPAIDLAAERFRLQVEWEAPNGDTGWGQPVPLSGDSAYFWFFNSGNVELVVKVLDGRAVNDHFWVFYGALSDVAYRLHVTDLTTGQERTYDNPSRHMASRGDTRAFTADGRVPVGSTAGSLAAPAVASAPAGPPLRTNAAAVGTGCTSGDGDLCLAGSRFRVTASWRDPRTGDSGRGEAVPLTGDSGYFWFFGRSNVELVVKVLDGRPVNQHHWVFFGSLTDVEFDLRVEDTATGRVRTYHNPGRQMASHGDTAAFGPREEEPDLRDFEQRRAQVAEEAAAMSPQSFAQRYPPPQRVEALSFDPLTAAHLSAIVDLVEPSVEDLEQLAREGSMIVDGGHVQETPEVLYSTIYKSDLPVLVTVDSLLHAVHRSYDDLLASLERTVLAGEMETLLGAMHAELGTRIAEGTLPAGFVAAAEEVDVYLAVGLSLLEETEVPTVLPASAPRAEAILEAVEGEGLGNLQLFGLNVPYDYSQMRPRGHYAGDPVLERYFRALMWLGRTEMPLVTFEGDHPEGSLNRPALDAAFLLHDLLQATGRSRWERVNRVIEEMVGERDSMDPRDVDRLRAQLGAADLAALASLSDETLRQALLTEGYGLQRIQSQVLYADDFQGDIVLPRVFLFLGQRFVIDSQVFHQLVFDRLKDPASGLPIRRMLPDPLDVQFALGSNVAAELLAPEVDRWGYQGGLHQTRFLVESHGDDFWRANLYSSWLDLLRTLEPSAEERTAQPEAMRTRAWDVKTLNARLASWAELRRDTLLYAKQSYSGGPGCEFPEVYLEPYPRFYAALARYAQRGRELAEALEADAFEVSAVRLYFDNLEVVARMLETIARRELAGEALTAEERDFLRRTSEFEMVGCDGFEFDGWYTTLFFENGASPIHEPTIADVHTSATDEQGNTVGWVLHAATGGFRWGVLTVEDCTGVQAYVGPVSTFYEKLTTGFDRWDDERWLVSLWEDRPEAWLDTVDTVP